MSNAVDLIRRVADAARGQAYKLVPAWLPGGRVEKSEYLAVNPRRPGDKQANAFKINLDTGVWCDFGGGPDDKGGDLVSLYAYLNDMRQSEAAVEVGKQVGIDAEREAGESMVSSRLSDKSKSKEVGRWIYRSRDPQRPGGYRDHLLVKRWEPGFGDDGRAKSFSQHNPRTGKSTKRDAVHPPHPVYALESIDVAPSFNENGTLFSIVVVVEGEKCYQAAQAALNDAFGNGGRDGIGYAVATTWAGGANSTAKTDWSPVAYDTSGMVRMVFIIPDNDTAGRRTAADIGRRILKCVDDSQWGNGLRKQDYVLVADMFQTRDPKWDIHDEYHNPDRSPNWDIWSEILRCTFAKDGHTILQSATVPAYSQYAKNLAAKKDRGEGEDPEPLPVPLPDPAAFKPANEPFKPLGYEEANLRYKTPARYLFHIDKYGKIHAYTVKDLNTLSTYQELGDMEYWATKLNGRNLSRKHLPHIAQWLVDVCTMAGEQKIWRTMHGTGVYKDGDNLLIHNGDKIYDTGDGEWYLPVQKSTPTRVFQSEAQLSAASRPDMAAPAVRERIEGAVKTYVDAVEMLPWQSGIMGDLIAGWTLLAPMCGALDWRAHVFLTGAPGLGKTSILRDVIGRALGDRCILTPGASTTEAGIRRAIAHHAIPLIRDEAQAPSNDARRQTMHEAILQTLRSASSETKKGGITHGDGRIYPVRTMALFAAVTSNLTDPQDTARFILCQIRKQKGLSAADYRAAWNAVLNRLDEVDRPDLPLSEAMFWFGIEMFHNVMERAGWAGYVIRESMKDVNGRNADHLGLLLAATYTMLNGFAERTPEDLRDWLEGDMGSVRRFMDAIDNGGQGMDFFQHLFSVRIAVSPSRHMTIEDLIFDVTRPDADFSEQEDAGKHLAQHGIRVMRNVNGFPENEWLIWFAAVNDALNGLLHGTQWAKPGNRREYLVSTGAVESRQRNKMKMVQRGVILRLGDVLDLGNRGSDETYDEGE